MPLIILSELTLMSIIFNAFISRGGKKVLFAFKHLKLYMLYSLSLKDSHCCWIYSNSEPKASCQSLSQKVDGQCYQEITGFRLAWVYLFP